MKFLCGMRWLVRMFGGRLLCHKLMSSVEDAQLIIRPFYGGNFERNVTVEIELRDRNLAIRLLII